MSLDEPEISAEQAPIVVSLLPGQVLRQELIESLGIAKNDAALPTEWAYQMQ